MPCTATTAPARSPGQRASVAAADPAPGQLLDLRAPLTPDTDQISFEVERIAAPAPGRLEVTGRWYGVRGRRFMRPTLALTRGDGSPEVRALADIDGKPWAADDGSEWTAAFDIEMTLDEAATAELSVSPDIAVELVRSGQGALGAGDRVVAVGSRISPLAKSSPTRRRPSSLSGGDDERTNARLAAAGDALQRERDRRTAAERALDAERERRTASERALEEERAEGRRLQLELGQLRAELELARTGVAEAGETATELESIRQQLQAAQRQIEEVGRERDRAARAHAETRTALNERTGALESARQALTAEQAETARLRETLERRPASAAGGARLSTAPGSSPSPAPRPGRGSSPALPEPDGDGDGDPEPGVAAIGRRVSAVLRGADAPASHGYTPPAGLHHQPSTSEAMRSHSPWFGRALALLFLIAVIVAVVLVINSTIH